MGRTRTKKKVASKATDPPIQHAAAASSPSVPALLEKAQTLIVQCDYELAERFVQRILDQQPTNAEAREMLGVVQLETGEIEAAKKADLFLPLVALDIVLILLSHWLRHFFHLFHQHQVPHRLHRRQPIYI